MNFIVDVIEGVEPDLMKFVIELEEVRKAAKVNDETLRTQIRNISNSIDEIKQELKHYSDESKIDSYERYHKVCRNTRYLVIERLAKLTVLENRYEPRIIIIKEINIKHFIQPKSKQGWGWLTVLRLRLRFDFSTRLTG